MHRCAAYSGHNKSPNRYAGRYILDRLAVYLEYLKIRHTKIIYDTVFSVYLLQGFPVTRRRVRSQEPIVFASSRVPSR